MTYTILTILGYNFSFYTICSFLTGVLILVLGIFVLRQNWRLNTHRAFFLVTMSCFLWLTGTSLEVASPSADTALIWMRFYTNYGVFAIAPSIYFLSVVFTDIKSNVQRFLVYLGFVFVLIFSVLISTTNLIFAGMTRFYWGFWPTPGTLRSAYRTYFSLYYAASLWNFYRAYRDEKNTLRKRQFGTLLLAFFVTMFGSIDYLPELGLAVLPIGFIFVASFVFVTFYSIVRYKLLDIETVIHQTIMWLITSSIMVVPLTLVFHMFRNQYAQPNWMIHFGTMACFFVVLVFYLTHVQPKIDHLFKRRKLNLDRALIAFNDSLIYVKDLKELSNYISDTIREVLYVHKVNVFIGKHKSLMYDKIPETERTILQQGDQFIQWLKDMDVIVMEEFLDLDPQYQEIKEYAKNFFKALETKIAFPLVLNNELIGLITLSQKENLKPFSASEITFLSDLRRAATIAASNSLRMIEMQESLRKWNEELEKKVAERTSELIKTQQQLIQAEKMATIGTLAGGVAHEINNPLTAVLTNAQLLKMDAKAEDLESLNLIEEGAKRCRTIVEKLMNYSRKSGTDTLENVDLNQVATNAVALLEYQLKQENITLAVEKTSGLPLIKANSNELEQVLTNLILNAKDAIKDTGRVPKIEVKTMVQNKTVSFSVKDNGRGIPKEHLSKIFDPFFTTKDVGKGTGLGLAVSHGIVEKYKGRIEVDSTIDKGSIFRVLFDL